MERTSHLTYIVRKKGGRKRGAHVNRLKFFDPLNSIEDPTVHISLDDDEPDQSSNNMPTEQVQEDQPQDPLPQQQQPSTTQANTRVTRSKTHSLPKPINRYSASPAEITNHWKHIPWISNELNIILQNEESTVGQNFPI